MKKITLTFLTLLTLCLSANAQFTLERTGLINTENPEQNYIVIEFEGKPQQELYQAVNVYLHSLYVNPQNVLSTIENQAITVNGISPGAIDISLKRKPVLYDIKYTISIAFKDDRIRINCPYIIEMSKWVLNSKYDFYVEGPGYPLYNGAYNQRSGKIQNETAKKSIEDFFNLYIRNIERAINGEIQNNNDW